MLKTCYSLASVAALGGMVFGGMAWAVGGCSSADPGTTPNGTTNDGGGGGGKDTGTNPSDNDTGTNPGDDSGGGKDTGGTTVNITYGKCPPFAKCASDPVGSWTLSGGCLSEDTFAPAKAQCPDLKESNVVIKASGGVNITATNVTRNSTVTVTATVKIPRDCAGNFTCKQIEVGLTAGAVPNVPKFDSAACKDGAANDCDCDVSQSVVEASNDTYTSAKDGDLTTSGAMGDRTFEYCVDGAKLSYLETTANSLPLIVEMKKQ